MKHLGILTLHVAAGSFVGWVLIQLNLRPWSLLFWIAVSIGITLSFMGVNHFVDGEKK